MHHPAAKRWAPVYLPDNVNFGGFDPKDLQISARGQITASRTAARCRSSTGSHTEATAQCVRLAQGRIPGDRQ